MQATLLPGPDGLTYTTCALFGRATCAGGVCRNNKPAPVYNPRAVLPQRRPCSAFVMFVLDFSLSVSLVQQIVDGFSHLVDEGTLRSAPSCCRFGKFADALRRERLDRGGCLRPVGRPGLIPSRARIWGFLCAAVDRTMSKSPQAVTATILTPCTTCAASSSTGLKPQTRLWLAAGGLARLAKACAVRCAPWPQARCSISGYGEPKGFVPLRRAGARPAGRAGGGADHRTDLLTQGSSHALDLIARRLVDARRPGADR